VKALKIVGILLGVLLLLTGAGLLAGSVLVTKGQGAFERELTQSGYVGPVEGVVQSVDHTNPVVVTVSYTDDQGSQRTGQGAAAGTNPPNVGDTVPTYYSTTDPNQIVVVNVPGLGNLAAVASTLWGVGIGCMIAGGVVLLTGILGLALGRKTPAPVAGWSSYPIESPRQPYPPQHPPYPPQPPPYRPQQYPPQR
jgi:Protein of unknown function (DUF3592)